ncbi:hypothetical protein [Lysinibacillus fusiformis]|uniref:hypothetical protein n=1 Tax=Lysinibacillus fusiformis TaxID=28031 RepID=UPI0030178E2F
MAKLNGVKTLDMQNGEITKVSYEGAEYALLGTDVEAKDGDLIQSNVSLMDVESGDFFKTFERDGDIEFKDNDNDFRDANYGEGRYNIFRKISAQSKSTLEQRVETLESDVAALKGEKESSTILALGERVKTSGISKYGYDCDDMAGVIKENDLENGYYYVKLDSGKGVYLKPTQVKKSEETIEFEGATYRKVEREAREGDVVIFRKSTKSWVTNGKRYVVQEGIRFIDNDGDSQTLYNVLIGRTRETVDVYEAIEQAKYVPQEGDIVVIVKSEHGSRNGVGDIGKVSDVSPINFAVDVPQKPCTSNARGNKHEAYEVRKATPAEVEKYEQAVKDAEIAEKWAKIGRKPNEFKKGDIAEVVEYNSGHKVGTIVEITHLADRGGDFRAKALGSTFYYKPQRLKLIAPVESTVA